MSESRQWAKSVHTPSIMSRIKAIFCGRRFTEPSEPVQSTSTATAQPPQTSEETPWWYHDLDRDVPPTPRPYEGASPSVSSPATLDANNCSSPATSMRSTTPPGTPPSLDAILSPIIADADFSIPLIREEPCISTSYSLDGSSKPTEALGLTIDTPLHHSASSDNTPQAPLTPIASPSKFSNQETAPELAESMSSVVSPLEPPPIHESSRPTTYDLFQQLSAKLHAEMRAMVVLQQHIEAKREIERLRRQVAILKEQKERNLQEIQENTRILAEKKELLGARQSLRNGE